MSILGDAKVVAHALGAALSTGFKGSWKDSSKDRKQRITWIGEVVLDEHLHRTAQIEILHHLAKRGYDVELCAIYSKDPHPIHLQGVKFISFPLRTVPFLQPIFFTILLVISLPFYVLTRKPRIIITEYGVCVLSFIWKPLLSRCTGLKVILDVRSIPVERSVDRRTAFRGFLFTTSMLMAKRLFDGITTVTTMMRSDIAHRYGIDQGLIGVWTNGVSRTLFDPSKYASDRARLRKENGLDKAFVVFYHGAVSHQRGIIESVKSIETLTGEYDDVVLFLLGNGPAVSTVRKLIHDRGVEGRVIMHDPVPYSDVPKYIAMSDVGLIPLPNHPDWAHQSPLNLLEYVAMEKPVIVTDIPCNRSIVGESECARYVSDADPLQFAEAIKHFHDRRETLTQLRPSCRTIGEKYDWSNSAKSLEEFLTSAIERDGKLRISH